VDIDAGALRAVFDGTHRAAIETNDQRESEDIGAKLRDVRKSAGLTQEQLASSSGIPQETLSRIETGRRHPRIETLRKLASGLGWDTSELLGRLASG
jgi:DNA-binding XRE family transcriptional regulator